MFYPPAPMRTLFLTLSTLGMLLSPLSAAAAGKADLINGIVDLYEPTGDELSAILLGEGSLERKFTTISNVLKTKHDTVKHSIGNIR